eukprot:TRINITY_DN11568_c0_g1_i1.p1 TRINITY_DN11568_c0_g1~~TRINITY_DN11568_c0_g1_i1.p1  ORF type:complete len:395 (+),score=5.78 TRINITY_DN11568_c0_g1_i1:394-1578(+)
MGVGLPDDPFENASAPPVPSAPLEETPVGSSSKCSPSSNRRNDKTDTPCASTSKPPKEKSAKSTKPPNASGGADSEAWVPAKPELNKIAQKLYSYPPVYESHDAGDGVFIARVKVGELGWTDSFQGCTKREAEHKAAQAMLDSHAMHLARGRPPSNDTPAKRLNELCQEMKIKVVYEQKDNEEKKQSFLARAYVKERSTKWCEGASKQAAKQQAARELLDQLERAMTVTNARPSAPEKARAAFPPTSAVHHIASKNDTTAKFNFQQDSRGQLCQVTIEGVGRSGWIRGCGKPEAKHAAAEAFLEIHDQRTRPSSDGSQYTACAELNTYTQVEKFDPPEYKTEETSEGRYRSSVRIQGRGWTDWVEGQKSKKASRHEAARLMLSQIGATSRSNAG